MYPVDALKAGAGPMGTVAGGCVGAYDVVWAGCGACEAGSTPVHTGGVTHGYDAVWIADDDPEAAVGTRPATDAAASTTTSLRIAGMPTSLSARIVTRRGLLRIRSGPDRPARKS